MKRLFTSALFLTTGILLNAQVKTIHNAELITAKRVNISAPLKSLTPVPPDMSGKRVERDNPSLERTFHPIPNPDAKPVGMDPALQRVYADSTSTTEINILSNWAGMNANVDPSDNTLAVSADYVIQMTNNSSSTYLRIWNKAGDLVVDHITVQAITGVNDFGDPNIIYDQQADRFVFVVLHGFDNKLLIAISQTSDPTGSWVSYTFSTPGGFPDYPKIAVWGNSYILTTNSNSPTIWAINRDALIAGDAIGTVQRFTLDSFGSIGFQSASPVTVMGSMAPPDGEPAMAMRVADDGWMGVATDHLELFLVNVNWSDVDSSTITGPVNLLTIPYNSTLCGFGSGSCIPQPGTSTKLDPLSDIVMDKAQYRNFGDHEAIVCSHVCNPGSGIAGIRWYELRKDTADWYIYQQGTYAPSDTNHRWMSSITINQFGTIALGYNISSHSVNPGVRMTGRTECDSLNTMGAPEAIGQEGTHFNSSYRYGDYNGIVSDPADGSFWLAGNYNPGASWATRVIHFSIDSCHLHNNPDTTNNGTAISQILFGNLSVIPVPADDILYLSFSGIAAVPVHMQMIDISGSIVMDKTVQAAEGENHFDLSVSALPAGTYILRLMSDSNVVNRKIIIQHE